jgi:uncharacterized protein involved in exopolysaccharide biosynthesis
MDEDRLEPYKTTFRRHRLLFLIPVVVALFVAAWSVLGAPKSYMATASLWVDNSAPDTSSLSGQNTSPTTPSQNEQTVLQELLSSNQFVLSVAQKSSLESYLASHPRSGFSPSALLSSLSGPGSMTTRVQSALGPNVVTQIPGPQVLQISFSGPSPAVAQSTLSALMTQLQASTRQYSDDYSQSQVAYFRSQYDAAAQAASTARAQAQMYLTQHPTATAQKDPTYSALLAAATSANGQSAQAATAMRQAQSGSASAGPVVHVIDPATLPVAATAGKKKQAEAILAGLFGGLVVSVLAVVLMTKRAARVARPQELVRPADEFPGESSGPTGSGSPAPSITRRFKVRSDSSVQTLPEARRIGRGRQQQ